MGMGTGCWEKPQGSLWQSLDCSAGASEKYWWVPLKISDCSTSTTKKCSAGTSETHSAGTAEKKNCSASAAEKIQWHHWNWIALLALLKKRLDCSNSCHWKNKIRLLHWHQWKNQTAPLVPLIQKLILHSILATKCLPLWVQTFCICGRRLFSSVGASFLPVWVQTLLGAVWEFGHRNNQLKNVATVVHSHWAHSKILGAGITSKKMQQH